MRLRPLLWLLLSVCCFIGAAYFWRLGDRVAAGRRARSSPPKKTQGLAVSNGAPVQSTGSVTFPLLSQPGHLNMADSNPIGGHTNVGTAGLEYRLSNSTKTVRELEREDSAILLENALI